MTLQSKIIELFEKKFCRTNAQTGVKEPKWFIPEYTKSGDIETFLLTTLIPLIQEEERARIDKEITNQFKYAHEHDNYDMRGVDWTKIIHPNTKE